MPTGQPDLDNASWKFTSQVTLGFAKLRVKLGITDAHHSVPIMHPAYPKPALVQHPGNEQLGVLVVRHEVSRFPEAPSGYRFRMCRKWLMERRDRASLPLVLGSWQARGFPFSFVGCLKAGQETILQNELLFWELEAWCPSLIRINGIWDIE